jgi:hypothetical protein
MPTVGGEWRTRRVWEIPGHNKYYISLKKLVLLVSVDPTLVTQIDIMQLLTVLEWMDVRVTSFTGLR